MPYNHPVARPIYRSNTQSSLDGSEKPVPSFRDFVKTVPPPNAPPQPNSPAPETSSPGSVSTPNPHSSISGESTWTRPSTWDYDYDAHPKPDLEVQSPGGFVLQPETYVRPSRDHSDMDQSKGPGQLFLEPRVFEPLLPDTSPFPSPAPSNAHPFEYETIVTFSPRPASESPPRAPLPTVPSSVPEKFRETSLLEKFPTPPSPSPSSKAKDSEPVTPSSAYGTSDRRGQSVSNHGLQTPDSTPRGRKTTREGSPGDRGLAHQFSIRITSPKKLVPRSAAPGVDHGWEDFEETTKRVTQDRISHDYHKALAEQYRDLAIPTPDVFEDDDEPSPFDNNYIAGDDANMAPQPLRLQKSPVDGPRDTETISLAKALAEFGDVDEEADEPPPRSPSPPRRRVSLREKLPALATGTLQMILPSQHNRKPSETSATSGDIPISAPPETTAFSANETAPVKAPSNPARYNRQRPRSRVYPTKRYSGMYNSRPRSIIQPVENAKSKKSKKSKKDKDKSTPYTPPLPLTLPSALSTESSPRPSAESRRRLPPTSSVPGTPKSTVGGPATPSAFATTKGTTLAQRRLGPQGPKPLQKSGPPAPLPLKSHFSHSSSSSAASPTPTISPAPTTGSTLARSPHFAASATNAPHAPSPLQHGLTHTQLFAPGIALTTSEPSPNPSPPLTAPAKLGSAATSRSPGPSAGYPRPMTRAEPPATAKSSSATTLLPASLTSKPRLKTKSKSATAALPLRPKHHSPGPPPPPPPPSHSHSQPRMLSPIPSALPPFAPRSAPLPPMIHTNSSSSSAATTTTSASLPTTPIPTDDAPRRSLVAPGLSLMRKAVELQRERKRGKAREELKRRIRVVGVDGADGVEAGGGNAGGAERSVAGLGRGRVEVLEGEEDRARDWL